MLILYIPVVLSLLISLAIGYLMGHVAYKTVSRKTRCFDFRERVLPVSFMAQMAVLLATAAYNAVFVQGEWFYSELVACGFGGVLGTFARSFDYGQWFWQNALVSAAAWVIVYPLLSFLLLFRSKELSVKPRQKIVTVLMTTVTNAPYYIIFGVTALLIFLILFR